MYDLIFYGVIGRSDAEIGFLRVGLPSDTRDNPLFIVNVSGAYTEIAYIYIYIYIYVCVCVRARICVFEYIHHLPLHTPIGIQS